MPVSWTSSSPVGRGARLVDRPEGAQSHSPRSPALLAFPAGSPTTRRHFPTSESGGDVFMGFQGRSAASSALGGVPGHFSCVSVHRGGEECGGRFPELSTSASGLQMDFAQEVVDELRARWPVMVDLFATSLNYRLPVYFSPLNDLMAVGTDVFLQSLGSPSGICLPSVFAHQAGPQQAPVL